MVYVQNSYIGYGETRFNEIVSFVIGCVYRYNVGLIYFHLLDNHPCIVVLPEFDTTDE